MVNDWEIIDDNGVIDSGNEDDMRAQFEKYVNGTDPIMHRKGDLKLIQVHRIFN